MPRTILCSLVIFGLLASNGCLVGPNYKQPEAPKVETWRKAPVGIPPAEAESVANVTWWDILQDPVARDLVQIALKENLDVQIAAARVQEFRARYGVVGSFLYPEVNGGAQAFRTDLLPLPDTENVFNITASVSWEPDFWGRVRRAKEAALAQFLSEEEGRRGVILSLVADVGTQYFLLQQSDEQLKISQRTLKTRQDFYAIYQARYQQGLVSEVVLRRAEAQVEAAVASVYAFQREATQRENAISVLLGRPPGSIPRGETLAEQPLPADVPAGLPAQLIKRRPDILQAEQIFAAANAEIGVAEAAKFPNISLTGLLGIQSSELGDLITDPSAAHSLFAGLTQPIFNSGRLSREVDVQRAQAEQARLFYIQTILNAFRDVNDALVAISTLKGQVIAQQKQVDALRIARDLASARYNAGISSYLEVLDAERDLFESELIVTTARAQQLIAYVQLYKALGGGWDQQGNPAL